MYRSFVCIIVCFTLIFSTITLSYASTDVTFPSPQPVYIDQGGYTIATVNSSGGVSFSSTSFVGAITNICQSLGSIISYYKTSDITVNQSNNTPRQTNFKGAIFDISMILSGIYADSSSIRNFINQANITLALIDNKLDSLYSVASSTNNYVYRIHDNTNTIEQELMDIHSEHGNLLESIYNTFYYEYEKEDLLYYDKYIGINNSNVVRVPLSEYPFHLDDTQYFLTYFLPLIPINNENKYTIYFPINSDKGSNREMNNTSPIYVFDEQYNRTRITNVSYHYSYTSYNNMIVMNIDNINVDLSSYKYFVLPNTINSPSTGNNPINYNDVVGNTPYMIGKTSGYKSYFELWRELYASDDIINSKEQQKPLEEQVLSDFTGDGSASVSIGDASNMAEISSDIKNGFNAGGSISGLMNVFNSDDATLFSWFTQSVSDEINTLYNPQRSNNNIINFIDKQYEFINNNFN